MNKIKLRIKREDVEHQIMEAIELAERYEEGSIVIQLSPSNDSLIITHQIGNSWESMGLGFHESRNRILKSYDCDDHEKVYWEGQDEIEENRILPFENSDYMEEVDDVMNNIESFLLSQQEQYSEIDY